jgi:hypothetical protein
MTVKTRRPLKWWIKKRDNPQLGVYYTACGRMTKVMAKRKKKSLYGDNVMITFETEAEYDAAIARLGVKTGV